ncbi:hypothetical protein [Mesorhizobium sp. NZP2298]|uniref:hypothetical protein n=1 Tax=Mesorhizobium sp. NZP2298 TaxID=2483403 RepID=UPI0015553383|nr:hypothetical protein [Mesorhizobium sp. NZP2298]QKC97157.1 hypothetical protein EB231_22590 [Mesorhizobium sp. NZP2298]
MVGQGGAGASVSSGAGFQARVAAYSILSSICEIETEFGAASSIAQVGFETRTSIDDLNLLFRNGSRSYIQAKATVDFSLATGELRSVFQQFEQQDAAGDNNERFLLVTSSRASKKVTFDLRAALEGFRSSQAGDFFRDQPKVLTDIIADLRIALTELRNAADREDDPAAVDRIIRKSGVVVLDVEAKDTLEQAIILVLQAKGYAAPSGVWGKAVADCVTYAKQRRTITIEEISKTFERFQVPVAELSQAAADDILKIELGEMEAASGREVVLLRTIDEALGPVGRNIIMEFFRFDGNCDERLDFDTTPFTLPNGLQFEVLLRAATEQGIARLINEHLELVGDQPIVMMRLNSDTDPDAEPCAIAQRERLRNAIKQNEHPLLCLHCGQTVAEPLAAFVEIGHFLNPVVGLVHSACLKPVDRVIGGAKSPFSEEHPELVNFDANAWFRAVNGGQRAFDNLNLLRAGPVAHMGWGGRIARGPAGQFLVEVLLKDGGSEIVTQRNTLHRFSKREAEEFVARLNIMFKEKSDAGDPFCYTDQSKGFGPRSILIEQFGAREKRREVASAQVRQFEQRLVAPYSRPGQWYAPVLSLRYSSSGDPVALGGAVILLTDPLALKDHLNNWREAGFEVTDYELVSVLTDADFDDFMRWVEDHGHFAVVDALLDPGTGMLASGVLLRSIESIGGDLPTP